MSGMLKDSSFYIFLRIITLSVMCAWASEVNAQPLSASNAHAAGTPAPQKWDAETERLFDGDPRRRLQGTRPEVKKLSTSQANGSPEDARPIAWGPLIPAEFVEDEIKTLYIAMQKPMARIGSYKSGGYQTVSQQFAVVAAMFQILSRHSTAVRWKEIAAPASAHFSNASRQAQVNNLQAYENAKRSYDDLGQLIRGERVEFVPASALPWSEIIELPQLMRRLQQGYAEGLRPWSADAEEFEKNQLSVIHESRIHAALAEILQQPSYELNDDDEYQRHGRRLKSDSQQILQSAQESNLNQVQRFVGELNKTCSRCHEDYK